MDNFENNIWTRSAAVPSIEVLKRALERLEELRANFGNWPAIIAMAERLGLTDYASNPGVCAFLDARVVGGSHIWDFPDYLCMTFDKNEDGHGISCVGFPVGHLDNKPSAGRAEYAEPGPTKWSNPRRLAFINYAIAEFNKAIEQKLANTSITFTTAEA